MCQAHEAQREVEEAAFQEPEEPPEPPQLLRVWVLMGGDGAGRHISMASGLHVFRQLHAQADLQVGASSASRVVNLRIPDFLNRVLNPNLFLLGVVILAQLPQRLRMWCMWAPTAPSRSVSLASKLHGPISCTCKSACRRAPGHVAGLMPVTDELQVLHHKHSCVMALPAVTPGEWPACIPESAEALPHASV